MTHLARRSATAPRGRLAARKRLCAIAVAAVAAAGIVATVHAASPAPAPAPPTGIHVDAAPAFACVTPSGTFGDQEVDGVCVDSGAAPAAAPGSATPAP